MSGPTFLELARAIAGQYPAPHSLVLQLEGVVLRVRSNSAAVLDDLRAYFGSFAVEDGPGLGADMLFLLLEAPAVRPPVELTTRPHAPGKRPDKERSADVQGGRIVRKQATGMVFLFGHGGGTTTGKANIAPDIAIGPCAANRNQLVNFLCARYMERGVSRGWALGHAAGVAQRPEDGGKALALCGFAGMGKSTLALHLVARGLDFLSNDRVLVEPAQGGDTAILHGIPKHPRLNPGTALGNPELASLLARVLPQTASESYGHLDTESLRAVEDKYDGDITACFGPGRFILRAPLAGVVVLNWTHDGGPLVARRVDLAERLDLLEAFRKVPGVFYLPPALGDMACLEVRDYVHVLAGIPALELCGGSDFGAAATACQEFLGGVRP